MRTMDRHAFVVGLSTIMLFLCDRPTQAQEKPEPPERIGTVPADTTEDHAAGDLPRIDLPEFLITGKETIDLPEFSKTTTDEQRTYDLASRNPDPVRREASRADLGNFPKEQGGFAVERERPNGKVTAGLGSYTTPFFDGWFGRDAGTFDFLLKGGYRSSRGYIPNTDFREGYSSISAGTYLPDDVGLLSENRVHGNLGFQGNGYRLFGSRVANRWRTVSRIMINLSTSSHRFEQFTYTAGLHVRSTSVIDSISTGETVLGLDCSASRTIEEIDIKGEAGIWVNAYDSPSANASPFFAQAGISGRFHAGEQWDLIGGIMFYLVRGSDTRSVGRLYPRVAASWYTSDWLTLFAKFEPYVQRNSLSAIVEENPYLVNDVRIRHQLYFPSFTLGAEADVTKSVATKVGLNVKQARDFPFYVDAASSGMWSVEYGGTTRIVSLEGSLYADVTASDHIGLSLVARTSNNSITDKEAPYFPSSIVSGLYQHRFPRGFVVATTMKLVGRQYTDPGNTESLPAFFLLDAKAEYTVVPKFAVSLAIDNILNQNQVWWKNYSGQPRTVVLGLSFTW